VSDGSSFFVDLRFFVVNRALGLSLSQRARSTKQKRDEPRKTPKARKGTEEAAHRDGSPYLWYGLVVGRDERPRSSALGMAVTEVHKPPMLEMEWDPWGCLS